MTNIYSGTIKTDGEYKTLTELTGVTFTQGTNYTIQVINPAFLREGTTGSGFYVFDNNPFKYIAGSDDLYIKVKYNSCDINIASMTMGASNTTLNSSNIMLSTNILQEVQNTNHLNLVETETTENDLDVQERSE